jgi:predicted HTH transcriptional regulator
LARIGLSDALERERQTIASDAVFTAVLRACAEPIAPGVSKERVRAETGQSKATVERRIAELVARGALVRESGNGSATYRSTGLLEA